MANIDVEITPGDPGGAPAAAAFASANLFLMVQSGAFVLGTGTQLLTYVNANLDATLVALAGVTFAANKGLYATGADAFSTYDLTAGGRALGGVAGTADTFPYFSASNVVTLGSITAAGRALLDDADASAQRTTLNVDASRLDLTAAPVFFDEFIVGSTEGGEMGEMGWNFTNGTWTITTATANHPGVARRASTAVSGTVASVFTGGGGTAVSILGSQIDEQSWIVSLVTSSTNCDYRFGFFSDVTANPPTHGAYVEKLTADTNWFGVNRLSSAETRADLGVAAAASTWFKLKIRRVDATTMAYSIDGGSETTIATHSPNGVSLAFGFQIIPTTANARSVDVDAFSMRLQPNAR